MRSVRLACVKPAASVRSEPGSNSQIERLIFWTNRMNQIRGFWFLRAPSQPDIEPVLLQNRHRCLASKKRRYLPEFFCDLLSVSGLRDPPGLRRLRFSSFKFNCQRANRVDRSSSHPVKAGFRQRGSLWDGPRRRTTIRSRDQSPSRAPQQLSAVDKAE